MPIAVFSFSCQSENALIRIVDGVRDHGSGRALPRFAGAEERLAGPVDDTDLHAFRRGLKTQVRIPEAEVTGLLSRDWGMVQNLAA